MSLTPPYSLLTRTAKGSQLTIEELDGNLLFLASTLSGSNTITGSVNFTGSLVDFLQVGTVTGSFSGDGSGLTGVTATATLPAGVVSSSLQFTNTDDVTFRNITASGNISASGNIEATGTGSFNHVYVDGDITIDNQGKVWLDGGQDTYIQLVDNNHIGVFAFNNQTLTIDNESIVVDGIISASNSVQIGPNAGSQYITISGSSAAGDGRGGSINVPQRNFDLYSQVPGAEDQYIILSAQGSATNIGIGYRSDAIPSTAYFNISGSTFVRGHITASGNISASGNITAVSMSGDGSGLTGITATLPAGVVSSSLQFTNTDDVTFRNITASNNIKGVDLFLTGGDIDLQNDGAQSNIKFYCESSNAHYTKLQAAPHSEYSGNPTATLPAYDFDFAAPIFQGNVTASNNISASGDLEINNRILVSSSLSSAGSTSGDIVKIGNVTTVAGLMYALTGSAGGWALASSGSGQLATSSLAIALGTNSTTNGMLLRGMVNVGHDPGGAAGGAIYLADGGSASYVSSTTADHVVRVIGHNYENNVIYFNPSNDWIVRS